MQTQIAWEERTSLTERLLNFCNALVGRFRGGLAQVNVVQSIIFAGMSGSAIADVAGTGRISIDMMTRNQKYTVSYAAAVTGEVSDAREVFGGVGRGAVPA